MKHNFLKMLILGSLAPFAFCDASRAVEPVKLIDYRSLDNDLIIESFRAGNHDPSMVNLYFFRVSLTGLIDADDQRALELPKRKKFDQDLGEFGQMSIGALSVLDTEKKGSKPIKFEVKGDDVRVVVAEMMRKYGVPEAQVAVQVNVDLFERQKKWGFLDQDTLIVGAQYFCLPYHSSEDKKAKDAKLTLVDNLGLNALISIEYRVNKKTDF